MAKTKPERSDRNWSGIFGTCQNLSKVKTTSFYLIFLTGMHIDSMRPEKFVFLALSLQLQGVDMWGQVQVVADCFLFKNVLK